MNKYIKLAIATIAGAAMVTSCDLNLTPISAIAYEEGGQLIQTQANLNALENGLLSSFRGRQNGRYVEAPEFQYDYYNATLDYGNNYGGLHKSDYNLTSGDYDIEATWSGNYGAIKNYNIFIAAADNVPDNLKKNVDVVLGEAYFFRAWSYLQLARHFGKAYNASSAASDPCVPLVLVYDQAEQPARATVAEGYAQIKSDLDQAATLLAGVKGAARSQKPTIDAVNALYANYYLDIADYGNAASYAHKVIDTGNYALASTAKEMQAEYVNDNGKEPIMQLAISLTEFTGNALNNWTLCQKDDKHELALRPYYIPTQTLIDSYDEGDLRFDAWFDGETAVMLAGSYYNVDQTDFYTFVKFWGNPALTSGVRNGRTAPKPYKIGEMYLIAAEAELAAGNATAAKADLNAIQSARGAEETEATTETVRKEWYRETVGEGLRKFCLKRWGIGFNGREMQPGAANVLQQGEYFNGKVFDAGSYFFQYPVPAYEMKINKNLVQNPGYDSM